MLLEDKFSKISDMSRKMIDRKNEAYPKAIEDLWARYERYAPPNFQQQFISDPAKHKGLVWEMVLANTLLSNGLQLSPARDDDRPDLCVLYQGRKIWIECTIPSRGENNSMDYLDEILADEEMHPINHDKNALRMLNSLNVKKDQLEHWLSGGICKPDEAFIIAINGQNLNWRISESPLPDPARVLYGLGDSYTQYQFKNGQYRAAENGYYPVAAIQKKNGNLVDSRFFLDKTNATISGLIYSVDRPGYSCFYLTRPGSLYCYIGNINAHIKPTIDFSKFMQAYY